MNKTELAKEIVDYIDSRIHEGTNIGYIWTMPNGIQVHIDVDSIKDWWTKCMKSELEDKYDIKPKSIEHLNCDDCICIKDSCTYKVQGSYCAFEEG